MAHPTSPIHASTLAHAVAMACASFAVGHAHAQDVAPATTTTTTLPALSVRAEAPTTPSSVTGFAGQTRLALPMQSTVITRSQLDDTGARRLADVIVFEPTATDAYNSPGYWDYLSVRGYMLQQRYNYRREGLPITAETVIPLENKQNVEILKGTSGMQAGTSSPGGLVNYIVKRPTAGRQRTVTLGIGERGTVGAIADLSDRAGADGAFGWRLNVARENRKPVIDHYDSQKRSLAALATEFRFNADSKLEAELEWSRQEGKSLPGHSLTGNTVPTPRRPDNLNNQPWSQPNVFTGLTGTVRYDQAIGSGWRWVSQAGTQRLRTDDRLAYPYGFECGVPGGADLCDRYGPNGEYDVSDYRSENERRRVNAAQTQVNGEVKTGAFTHKVTAGIQVSSRNVTVQPYASNYVGVGNIDGSLVTPADPTIGSDGTNSRERTTELFANSMTEWGRGFSTWLGLRHTRLHRQTVETDGSEPSDYRDGVTTPWVAATYQWHPRQHVYASWGQGVESYVVPSNLGGANYPNPGQSLIAKSRQWEVGTKGIAGETEWSLAWFDIDRPAISDDGNSYVLDGVAHHRGIDATVTQNLGAWRLRAGAMLLKATREGAADTSLNGQRPINVPDRTLKAQVHYRVAELPGLELQTHIVHEGRRNVLGDASITLPSWTRTDAVAKYAHRVGSTPLTWTFGVLNVFDRRVWKEAPNQYGHVYLFPLEARTFRLTVSAEL